MCARKINVRKAQTELPFMDELRAKKKEMKPKDKTTKRFLFSREESAKILHLGDD